ncbi:hypothetical protein DOTSEDRAFT_162020 [Dothistroma septosporum NZE10]|uniref:ferric-chelate reductase (NADPH) n=1 Tax=Dothistroma septosporum (strain NZE10 / CBS 128990) TaxID=675120 RepID=N1Q1F7_DOTSN|nr:hypothetical protein DOTSEDRAFT_162020 [Dothistroma septosporum NZE10]
MYHFVDLTEGQKLQRRDLLDGYGLIAQVSVVVPLLALQVYRVSVWAQLRLFRTDVLQTPSSPYVKASRLGHGLNAQGKARWRKFLWWCGDSVEYAGLHLGTRGEILGAGIWTLWLLLLSFMQTGDDYLHLTKRLGAVGASQLPLHYLLSLKSPYSPLQLLTRRSHESLIALHQLLGRIITGFFYAHVVLYLNFYIQSNLLLAKITQFYIICGIFGIISLTAIGTTALKPLRDWSYRVFYIVHVVLATLVLPALYFHVHHIRIYIYETLLVYALHMVLRAVTTKTHTGSIKVIPDSNLVEIDIPVSGKAAHKYRTGQHAYMSLARNPFLRMFKSNPFTVASIPSTDNNVRFVARILDGNTAKLASSRKASQQITIEGPYGLATHDGKLLRYDRVLFVAGGVGATFIVPLYRRLLSDLSPSKGSHRRQRVTFIWTARFMSEISWALPQDAKEREGFVERLQVHLTKDVNVAAGVSSSSGTFAVGEDEEHQGPVGEGEDGIELEEQKDLLNNSGSEQKGNNGLVVQTGRPDLTKIVEQTFTHSNSERVAVVVCGPRGISKVLRREVGRFVRSGRDVWYLDESFST